MKGNEQLNRLALRKCEKVEQFLRYSEKSEMYIFCQKMHIFENFKKIFKLDLQQILMKMYAKFHVDVCSGLFTQLVRKICLTQTDRRIARLVCITSSPRTQVRYHPTCFYCFCFLFFVKRNSKHKNPSFNTKNSLNPSCNTKTRQKTVRCHATCFYCKTKNPSLSTKKSLNPSFIQPIIDWR